MCVEISAFGWVIFVDSVFQSLSTNQLKTDSVDSCTVLIYCMRERFCAKRWQSSQLKKKTRHHAQKRATPHIHFKLLLVSLSSTMKSVNASTVIRERNKPLIILINQHHNHKWIHSINFISKIIEAREFYMLTWNAIHKHFPIHYTCYTFYSFCTFLSIARSKWNDYIFSLKIDDKKKPNNNNNHQAP